MIVAIMFNNGNMKEYRNVYSIGECYHRIYLHYYTEDLKDIKSENYPLEDIQDWMVRLR